MKDHDENCSFCNPKRKDWEENNFYGFRCPECQGNTAFIVSTKHRGILNEKEKLLVEQLAKKHYPNLKITWMSEKRTAMSHFYDFLKPNN
jgi:hypothetical protein